MGLPTCWGSVSVLNTIWFLKSSWLLSKNEILCRTNFGLFTFLCHLHNGQQLMAFVCLGAKYMFCLNPVMLKYILQNFPNIFDFFMQLTQITLRKRLQLLVPSMHGPLSQFWVFYVIEGLWRFFSSKSKFKIVLFLWVVVLS